MQQNACQDRKHEKVVIADCKWEDEVTADPTSDNLQYLLLSKCFVRMKRICNAAIGASCKPALLGAAET